MSGIVKYETMDSSVVRGDLAELIGLAQSYAVIREFVDGYPGLRHLEDSVAVDPMPADLLGMGQWYTGTWNGEKALLWVSVAHPDCCSLTINKKHLI